MELSHLSTRELREKHKELVASAQAILDRATSRGGKPSAAEQRQFDEAIGQATDLAEEIEIRTDRGAPEGLGSASSWQDVPAHARPKHLRNAAPRFPETRDGRVLGDGESVFEVRRRQGWTNPNDEQYEGLTLGRFLRSMVAGPRDEIKKRALSEGSDSAGGYSVP